jgi:hypothetical protein
VAVDAREDVFADPQDNAVGRRQCDITERRLCHTRRATLLLPSELDLNN